MVSLLCGSVWGRAQRRDSSCSLASGVLSRRKLSTGTHPDARHLSLPVCHWCPSSCCSGAGAQTDWVCVSPESIAGPLGRDSRESAVSSAAPTPLVFTARSYGDLSSWHCNPGLGGLVWGWDSLLPRYPTWFLSITCRCGTACSASPCLRPSYLSGWMWLL